MARIKGGLNAKKKHNRVLKLAKGYRGARSNQYRVAKQSVMRALASSYTPEQSICITTTDVPPSKRAISSYSMLDTTTKRTA